MSHRGVVAKTTEDGSIKYVYGRNLGGISSQGSIQKVFYEEVSQEYDKYSGSIFGESKNLKYFVTEELKKLPSVLEAIWIDRKCYYEVKPDLLVRIKTVEDQKDLMRFDDKYYLRERFDADLDKVQDEEYQHKLLEEEFKEIIDYRS